MDGEKGILIYDGECGLCQWSVRFVKKRDRFGVFTFSSSQSAVGKELLEKHKLGIPSEVILIQKDSVFAGAEALIRIMQELPQPWCFLGRVLKLIPQPINRFVYAFVAKNRYLFGRQHCSIR
jgi:predicted DCC family thiol-disulfide oxidoreductase YuxK